MSETALTLGDFVNHLSRLNDEERGQWRKVLLALLEPLSGESVVGKVDTQQKKKAAIGGRTVELDRWGTRLHNFPVHLSEIGVKPAIEIVGFLRSKGLALPPDDATACDVVRRKCKRNPKTYGEFGNDCWGLLIQKKPPGPALVA
jgi:hypothetical protein